MVNSRSRRHWTSCCSMVGKARNELIQGVVSAPLWNTQTAKFAGKKPQSRSDTGMFTVQDVIHLIQYYYHTSSWEGATADVEQFRLESIRGERPVASLTQTSKRNFMFHHPRCSLSTRCALSLTLADSSSKHTLDAYRSSTRTYRLAARWSSPS
jgi:hypothetical protein